MSYVNCNFFLLSSIFSVWLILRCLELEISALLSLPLCKYVEQLWKASQVVFINKEISKVRQDNLQRKFSKHFSMFNNKYRLLNSQVSRCWNDKNPVGRKSELGISTLNINLKKPQKWNSVMLGIILILEVQCLRPHWFSFYCFLLTKFSSCWCCASVSDCFQTNLKFKKKINFSEERRYMCIYMCLHRYG